RKTLILHTSTRMLKLSCKNQRLRKNWIKISCADPRRPFGLGSGAKSIASHLPLKKEGALVDLALFCVSVTDGHFTAGCNRHTDRQTDREIFAIAYSEDFRLKKTPTKRHTRVTKYGASTSFE